MSPRPLRQYYGHDRRFVLDGLASPVEPFRRHRARFLAALEGLTEDQWAATTRCDAWSAKDVANHLVSADGFWALTLKGRANPEPTTFLRGFDPTTSPEQYIAPERKRSTPEVLDALRTSTAQLDEALAGIGEDEWSLPSESPFGHVPVRVIASHALWDSWLHERDVLLPLGHTPPVEEDELVTAAAFTLFLGGAQGGVLDDDEPVGEGPAAPVDVTVAFDDLPEADAVRLSVDQGVLVAVGPPADRPVAAGSAVEFVEALTGRADADPVLRRLPEDAAAQLRRAREIL